MSGQHERIDVFFSGRVQGVGFRFTTRNVARSFAVTGTVRNLPDGRVHLVVEGAGVEIDAFVAAVEEAMHGLVTGRDTRRSAATGEFDGFGVAR